MDDDTSDESFKICVEVMQNHNKLDDAEWNATVEQSIAALGLHPNLFSFFCEKILPRLKHLVSLSTKVKLEKYSEILQTSFATTQITEMDIKRLLVKVANSVLFNDDISIEDSQIDFAVPTDSDKKIITYLAGAVLNWGIKRFTNEEKEWCLAQVGKKSLDESVLPFTPGRNLIVCKEEFVDLIIQCKLAFRKKMSKKHINVKSIIDGVNWQVLYGSKGNKNAILKLLKRYTRMRSHIAAKHFQSQHFNEKRQVRLQSRSTGLRKSLQSSNNVQS